MRYIVSIIYRHLVWNCLKTEEALSSRTEWRKPPCKTQLQKQSLKNIRNYRVTMCMWTVSVQGFFCETSDCVWHLEISSQSAVCAKQLHCFLHKTLLKYPVVDLRTFYSGSYFSSSFRARCQRTLHRSSIHSCLYPTAWNAFDSSTIAGVPIYYSWVSRCYIFGCFPVLLIWMA